MTYLYIPGRGYTVRNPRGLVIARDLNRTQLDAVLKCQNMGVIPQSLLDLVMRA